MTHKFDAEIAEQVGILGAVLYDNIEWWCLKNKSSNINEQDGEFWTYNSNRGWAELFTYATVNQIKLALKKLEDSGLIISGSFNKAAYDRTKWYRPKSLIHQTEKSNETDRKVQPIPSNKPSINTAEGNPTEKQVIKAGNKLNIKEDVSIQFYLYYESRKWRGVLDFVPLLRKWNMNQIPSKKEEQKQVGGVTW